MRRILSMLRGPIGGVVAVLVIAGSFFVLFSYQRNITTTSQSSQTQSTPTEIIPTPSPTLALSLTPSPTATPIVLPAQEPAKILGIDGDPNVEYKGIKWIRTGYPSCGWGNLRGETLKKKVQDFHRQNIRVLFTICQPTADKEFNESIFADVASAYPDAVQCGNEQMKQDAAVSFLYYPPDKFAKFYDMCERAIHKVRPETPVLMGSLDPHVASADYQKLLGQVAYLNQVQDSMNRTVKPGGNWEWRKQKIGLIDSWHNGYLGANNLYDLFLFWSQQFNVDLNSGKLGRHLWVVEGTACFRGCGVDENSPYAVSVSHILSLVSNVQNAKRYGVPHFYFSGKDFVDQGIYWPIGIKDINGKSKPIRQDLPMGARTLTLSCPGGKSTNVQDQLDLLSKLYSGCNPPANYADLLSQ